MLIALAQLNPTVGDLPGNSARITDAIRRAEDAGADLILCPELSIVGYPPKDLVLEPGFIRANVAALHKVAESARRITAVVGYVEPNNAPAGRPIHNAAAVCRGGRVESIHCKTLLPTYDVFDENRYFEPSKSIVVETLHGRDGPTPAGITICEDLWNEESVVRRPLYRENPVAVLAAGGAKLIVNISASPFDVEKEDLRRRIFAAQAERHRVMIAYCNQVGGNDDLVFDGASAVFDASGRVVAQAKAFEEDLLFFNTADPAGSRIEPYPEPIERIHKALVLGTRDYVHKCRFKSVVLGLSGGLDSAVTAAIAVEALGPDAVRGVAMPSRFSSNHSMEDARQLAANLGIKLDVIPIESTHAAIEAQLADVFRGRTRDVTEENLQARIRGMILMALTNKFGWLLLTTGNKSELAVGYCTLYGDMCGGLAVISDVPKTAVYDIARYINQTAGAGIPSRIPLIPERTISKPPSAELRPNQTDQDSLPPYPILDAILRAYIEEHRTIDEIVALGYERATVTEIVRKVDLNEYKRKQMPPGIKVTSRAFGTGRRMPIAARYGPW